MYVKLLFFIIVIKGFIIVRFWLENIRIIRKIIMDIVRLIDVVVVVIVKLIL